MGVQGLTPFLMKICPALIKKLPNRLQEIKGKRIVIDGTLITQRLHFAQGHGLCQHVLGWYKIVRELRENGVSAICVFDGDSRSHAKTREVERRRELRRLQATRGSIETDRFERLNKLKNVTEHFQGFDIDGKRFVAERLSVSQEDGTSVLPQEQIPPLTGDQDSIPALQEQPRPIPQQEQPPPIPQEQPPPIPQEQPPPILQEQPPLILQELPTPILQELPPPILQEQPPPIPQEQPPLILQEQPPPTLQEQASPIPQEQPPPILQEQESPILQEQESPILQEQAPPILQEQVAPILHEQPPPIPPEQPPPILQEQASPILPEQVPPVLQEQEPPPPPVYPTPPSLDVPLPTTEDLSLTLDQTLRTFESLSLNFKANVAKLASVTPSEPLLSSSDEDEDRVYRVMTKAQNQLTTDEGEVWEKIATSMSMYAKPAASTPPLDFPISTINDIHTLADKSYVMSTSFLRRNNVPTDQTYRESKEILKALGIPCIDATDATEAEALASAIVHEGLADFVATEDTDVLVYEVPMIRGITNRVEPLVMVSGAEVRAELDLDRDAYIDFALLLGTDFSQRIANVGPMRAYKFIKSHGSIERIIELETKYEPKLSREDYLAEVELGRLIFKTLPTVPLKKLKKPRKDDKEVGRLLKQHGLTREFLGATGDFQSLLDGNYFRDDPIA